MMLTPVPKQTEDTPAVTVLSVGRASTFTVGVLVICKVQLAAFVASTLKVVALVRFPVGKLMVFPSPATGLPISESSALFLN